MGDASARSRSLLAAVAIAGALFLAYYAAMIVVRPGDTYLRFHSNVIYNVPALLALALAPVAIHRSRGRERAGWICLALVLVCWQTADWSYAYYTYVLGREVPFPGLPDIAYYAGYAAFAAAIALLAFPEDRLRDPRWLIDATLVMTVAGALGWQFVMEPIVVAGDSTLFAVEVAIGYPMLDLALLAGIVVAFFAGSQRFSLRVTLLALATIVQVTVDAAYTYEINTGSYNPLGDPIDLGWILVYALFAVTFVLPAESADSERRRHSFLGLVLPYAVLAPLAVIIVSEGGRPEVEVSVATAVVMVLILLRQALTMRENVTLLRLLELALAAERENARRDALTGVLNHGGIAEELKKLVAAQGTAAVVMLDIDGMKATNDMFGHQIGDRVLVEVAQAMSRGGAIVGRYGGDEFIGLLPRAGRAQAESYRDAIAAELAGVHITDPESGSRIPIEVSTGLSVFPEESDSVAGLIGLSDGAMYAAKRERPLVGGEAAAPQPLRDERAARMVGDLVPLLTSAGTLTQKMELVAHRLSVGAAYDLVAFTLFNTDAAAHVTYSEGGYRWQGVPPVVARSATRTLMLNDLDAADDHGEWTSLRSDGMRSALVAPMIWQDEPMGTITVACRRPDVFRAADAAFLMAVATHVTAIVRMAHLVDQLSEAAASLEEARAETVMMLAVAAEAHDRSTGMHLQTIRALAESLARDLGYGEADAAALGLAAILHDIGKLSVPEAVLSRADKLDEGEWEQMKQHTVWGAAFLGSRPGFTLAASVARSHHERWDGAGYPDGLAGNDIPEEAAIVTVADSFDAMTHGRPYRAGRAIGDAVEEVRRCSGTQFSPRVVDALLRLYERGQLPLAPCADNEHGQAAA